MDKIKIYEELLKRAHDLLVAATDGFPLDDETAIAADKLGDEIRKAIESELTNKAETEITDNGWINMKDKKPEKCSRNSKAYSEEFVNSDYVLIATKRGNITIAFYCFSELVWYADNDGVSGIDNIYRYDEVIYWRPLPNPPKGV